MTIYPMFNGLMYYAIEWNPKKGGFIGRGITHTQALINCLKAVRYASHNS